MGSRLDVLNLWVQEVAQLTKPDAIRWCDGSESDVKDRWFLEHKKLPPRHHII